MATKEAPKAEEVAEAPPPERKAGKKKLLIMIGAGVLVLVIGVAAAMMLLKKAPPEGEAQADEAVVEEPAKEEEAAPEYNFDPKKPPVFVNLEPFTVNLQPGSGGEQFLQLVVTLRVVDDKVGEQVKLFMPQIRHEILASASSRGAADITAPDGRDALADEIREVVNEVLGFVPPPPPRRKPKDWKEPIGPVVQVYFTQLIVQ